jgi:NAD+ kinase
LSIIFRFCCHRSAYNRSWEGDHSLYTGAFLKRHSSLWRLTDRGRDQARTAGDWLREHCLNLPDPFAPPPGSALAAAAAAAAASGSSSTAKGIYRYYVSEYIRAMETAALMGLPDAKWFVEVVSSWLGFCLSRAPMQLTNQMTPLIFAHV